VKAKLPLHVRVFDCHECPLVMDRDANAARNLAALAAACTTGTGVAGDQDAQASKPRGADQKTRTTRRSPTAAAGRAGGATLPHWREETRDRRQAQALTLRRCHGSQARMLWPVGQGLGPGRAGGAGGRINTGVGRDGPHGAGGYRVAEADRFTLHAAVAPGRILRGRAKHLVFDFRPYWWAPRVTLRVGPFTGDEVAVLAQQRRRGDEEGGLPCAGQQSGQG
jgi:hypothetical protein